MSPMVRHNRRTAAAHCVMAIIMALFHLAVAPAQAAITLDITGGQVEPMPIAVPDFIPGSAEGAQAAGDITAVITANLGGSGLFRPLPRESFVEQINDFSQEPRFGDWRTIQAQALVTGQVTLQPDGRLRAEFRLWDIFAQQQVVGLQFAATPKSWRRIAHKISDAIYKAITGEEGYFDSRVVFVDESGPKDKRVKRLAIMDQDGENVRTLTSGDDLVITPRFSPGSQEITYMSFAGRYAARLSVQYRNETARDRRRFSEHDVFAALLARRAAGDHEPAIGRQCQHLRARPVEPHDAPAHHQRGDRHGSVLFPRRQPDRVRVRPRRRPANLRDER